MFSREQLQRAIEDALKSMEGVALELYRRGREEAREELETVKRERDEARADDANAYRRGAEAMREACARWFREHDESFELTVDACHDVIADMPIPEEP